MTGRPYAPNSAAIERAIAETDVGNQVRRLGVVPEPILAALYRGAHALVYPSLFEGLGLPLLEAMHNRTPVIASNTTCIPEVVGPAGILFDPFDHVTLATAMERAWREPEWVKEPLKHAASQLQLFDWQPARKTFGALYRKVTGATLSIEKLLLQVAAA
jgi:glycosyltransferase involved in cell wall biosynthesis